MSDVGLLILLFLFGAFAILSAVLKARARITAPAAVILAVLEGLAGLVLMAVSRPTSGSLQTASAVGIATAALIAMSSTVHLVHVRNRRRARDASQERRLYQSIKYGVDARRSAPPEADLGGTAGTGEERGAEPS